MPNNDNLLNTPPSGLTAKEVSERLKQYGPNLIHKKKGNTLSILKRQITGNPLIIILAIATLASFFLGQKISSIYIFAMILLSIILGFWNEYSAEKTIENLLKKISLTTLVIRDNDKIEIPVSHLTIGDIVLLSEGSIIPADLKLIETNNLEVNESALSGESITVYKTSDQNSNIAYMGTVVESGSGKGIVTKIGKETEFGKIAQVATYLKPITNFQKGLAGFGKLITKVILILSFCIFAINSLLGHQILESLLFALAIAVGLTPELLPVIVTVSLSHGAGLLAKKHVIAKKLISIENFGNMDVLAIDKTGTLTEGKIKLVDYIDCDGNKDTNLLTMSLFANSAIIHNKIIGNAIDKAIWEHALENNITLDPTIKKIDEEPFDYNKKLMYAVLDNGNKATLIVKGEPDSVISVCRNFQNIKEVKEKLTNLSKDGMRLVALAYKTVEKKPSYSWSDVENLTFHGYITFLDTPKKSATLALLQLKNLSVRTVIITGDNELVTQKVCNEVGINTEKIILGNELETISDKTLKEIVASQNIFARVTPMQKLKIIQALKDLGHTVGYMGDGINDLPALQTADVGISVNTAVDVAKDAASIVLLRKSLSVLADGIIEGRKTFINTVKYILMGTSSNFGNMFSAAGASFFLPFLPMTPVQILITNGLYDASQLAIPYDNVDLESLSKPKSWNIEYIKKYMIFFGPLSSIYDFITYGVMLFIFNARGGLFQTGWFIESLATEILVIFVIRTSRTPFYKSTPGKYLTIACLLIVSLGILLPFSPLANHLGFVTPPPFYFVILIFLVITYLTLVEKVKNIFLRRYSL